MNLRELVAKNRSYRRFDPSIPISLHDLEDLVELARITPSAANRQPLKYVLSADPEMNAAIFPTLGWAAYLSDWPGPAEHERPTGYIAICVDTSISKEWWCDDGIVAQTMLLAAVEKGFGGCMIGAIKHKELHKVLGLPDHLQIRLVLALGAPAEMVLLEGLGEEGSIKYWRDDNDVHHVPKRPAGELIYKSYG